MAAATTAATEAPAALGLPQEQERHRLFVLLYGRAAHFAKDVQDYHESYEHEADHKHLHWAPAEIGQKKHRQRPGDKKSGENQEHQKCACV